METQCAVQEFVARCEAILVEYHNAGRTARTMAEMVVAVRGIATEVMDLGLGATDIVEQILHPVEARMLARYGYEAGARIYDDFHRTFEAGTRGCCGGWSGTD